MCSVSFPPHIAFCILAKKFHFGLPLIAVAGDDVVLPCQLEPPVDAVQMTIEWGKPDLNPRFVFVRHNGQELQTDQNTAYKGRVSLTIDKLKHGDVSLKLSKVKVSDSGRYRCYIPQQSKEYFGELLFKIHFPFLSGVMLECKSAGWYPEPEVIWMDSDGNHLSAGPTETQRGPNDLYTVSSRVATQPRFIFKVLTDGRRFWLKISRYMAPFILSLTRISRPVPLAEKQPHSMMFPPPFFTVGMVFLGCNSVFFSSKHDELSLYQKVLLWFHLTT
uniref:Ig-like domain-containing protein n=1 Tax=Maylandia zebra TaxID=106582 RepID=A0A3P9AV14_9CICH